MRFPFPFFKFTLLTLKCYYYFFCSGLLWSARHISTHLSALFLLSRFTPLSHSSIRHVPVQPSLVMFPSSLTWLVGEPRRRIPSELFFSHLYQSEVANRIDSLAIVTAEQAEQGKRQSQSQSQSQNRNEMRRG